MALIDLLGNPFELVVALLPMVAVVAFGRWFERRTDAARRRRGLPQWLRTAVVGASFGTYVVVLFAESVTVPVVDETIAAFALFVVLWLGLPYVASQFVDWEARATEESGRC